MSNKKFLLRALQISSIFLLIFLMAIHLPEDHLIWRLFPFITALIAINYNRKKFQQPIIEDPVSHVRFDGEFILIGDHSIKRSEIRKVAIDSVKDRGYFSLPYNQISPGEIPEFIFPSSKFTSFRAHLQKEFDTNVEFIT
ncbi:hypothetical protein [Microbulbifer sp. DLAB2-AA]|uniref:hypothetical protein n=1 Tax=Microbulbifer sp. DLAB2-AA TaxID=3243394 RepID=UPI00403A1A89